MEFRQFRYILKVAEAGSISLAAQKLYISQPSLSQLVTGVEKKLGGPLFDRSAIPLRPTPLGELYLDAARRALDLDRQFHQQVADLLGLRAGHVTLGSTPFRSTHLLAAFLPLFHHDYPAIQIELHENSTYQLEKDVLRGDVDIALSLLPVHPKQFESLEIFSEEVLLALPPGHPLARGSTSKQLADLPVISLASCKDLSFIAVNKEQKLHNTLYSLAAKAGFSPKIGLETRSMYTARAMVGVGLGAAILPTTIALRPLPPPDPAYVRLDTHPTRTAIILWRKARYLSRAAHLFIERLKTFCERLDDGGQMV